MDEITDYLINHCLGEYEAPLIFNKDIVQADEIFIGDYSEEDFLKNTYS